MSINRAELIRQTAKRARVTKEKAGEVLDAALEVIRGSLEAGEDIRIPGFGSLEIRERQGGVARNFHTGETMPGKKRKLIAFVASADLKRKINSQEED